MPFEHPQRPLAGTVFPPPRPPSPSDFRAHTVVFGDLQLAPAYPSFYPQEDMSTNPVDKLFVCPTCFKYTEKPVEYVAHKAVCRHRDELPGQLVYDGHPCNIYEVDGEDYPVRTATAHRLCALFADSDTSQASRSEPLAVFQALHRKQIGVLRCTWLYILPSGGFLAFNSLGHGKSHHDCCGILQQREAQLGQQQPCMHCGLPAMAKIWLWADAYGSKLHDRQT